MPNSSSRRCLCGACAFDYLMYYHFLEEDFDVVEDATCMLCGGEAAILSASKAAADFGAIMLANMAVGLAVEEREWDQT